MTEHVQADTTDLARFTTHGSAYRSNLAGILTELERRRSTVTTALGHVPPTNWIDPFDELLTGATSNDRFVQTVHDALVDPTVAGPPIMGTGGPLDRPFGAMIVDALVAEIDAWTGHPNDPRTTELREALAAEVERLVGGDQEVARQVRIRLAQGDPAAEALFDGVVAAAADVADVNTGVAAMAQDNDLSYNSAIALINMEMGAEDSDWPPGWTPLSYLDVPIVSGEEAALMLMADEEGLFRVIETANQGDIGEWDGKLSDSDLAAVLDDPEAFDDRAVAIARFFRDSPEEWVLFDTAREGVVLQNLADGRAGVGDGDGITSFADVQQYVTNHQLFTTLSAELDRADSVIRDLDANGQLDPEEFEAALSALEATHPNFAGLTEAINVALDQDLLDPPDNRAWYEKVGDGLVTVSSLFPGSPTHLYRLMTKPGELAQDHLSFATGAGSAVVGLGLFAYDLSAVGPNGPGYWIENWRVDGDPAQHRGRRLVQAVPHLADAGLSLLPGTPQYAQAMEDVHRQGTWDAHPGLQLGWTVADWEGFVEDPARWAGQFAPEVLITVLTGGGGVVTRLGTTGSRAVSAARRLVVGVSDNGLKATAGTALRRAGIPQSQWHGRDQTGLIAHGDRGEQLLDPRIAERQGQNAELRNGDRFATDQATAGVDQADIDAMFDGRRPLGFTSEAQYAEFADELAQALKAAGLDDAEIGLKGTATTFYSENPGKPLGHHWDADPANPGDYDLNLTSEHMVAELRALGLEPHPTYGVFRTRDITRVFPAIDEFQNRWGEILGREVNVVGYPGPAPRDVTEYVVVAAPGS